MATTSTIPDVSDALVALVSTAMPGVKITDGRPADKDFQFRELAYLGDTTGDYTVPVMKSGRRTRSEDYDIQVVVWVAQSRGSLAAAKRRAVELLTGFCNVLADTPNLGGVSGVLQATAGSFAISHEFQGEGAVAVATLDVSVSARLN